MNGCNQEDEQFDQEKDEKTGKPAELFRKDLISAMKVPDMVHMPEDTYYNITDPWRMDWEKGVQVPVQQEQKFKSLKCMKIVDKPKTKKPHFSMPAKYLHACQDSSYHKSTHQLYQRMDVTNAAQNKYDEDDIDRHWLHEINTIRRRSGREILTPDYVEELFEGIEGVCFETMQTKINTVVGLGIEYDENIVCDICRSPDSEDTNEMVFCDKCDVCVHQACYGIQNIPTGSWLCRVCVLGIKPPRCKLCPNTGGAMKATPSGDSWCHVSCALWIPEVSFGCADKMEPVINIAAIPTNRWALNCSICREKNNGACIQCAVRTCNVAFHVTCSIRQHLLMQTVVDYRTDDVRFKAYCSKHTKSLESQPVKPVEGTTVIDNTRDCPKPKVPIEMDDEQIKEMRSQKLEAMAKEFYLCTAPTQLITVLANNDRDILNSIFTYWRLKRRSQFNCSLVETTDEVIDEDTQEEMNLVARVRMFVHLRQDLERVRNLTYMVNRREKLSRQYLHVVCNEFSARRRLWDVKPTPLKRRRRRRRLSRKSLENAADASATPRCLDYDDDDDDDEEFNKPLKELSNQTSNESVNSEISLKRKATSDCETTPTNHPKHLSTKKQRKQRRIEDAVDTFLLSPTKTSTLYDLHESILEQVKLDNLLNESEAARTKEETPVAPRCVKTSSKVRATTAAAAAAVVSSPGVAVEGANDGETRIPANPTPAAPAKAVTVRKYTQRVKADTQTAAMTYSPGGSAPGDTNSLPGPAKKIIMDAYERSNIRAAHSKSQKEPQKKKKPEPPIVSEIRQNVQNSISDFFRKSINKK